MDATDEEEQGRNEAMELQFLAAASAALEKPPFSTNRASVA
jgi:hypothetical protein